MKYLSLILLLVTVFMLNSCNNLDNTIENELLASIEQNLNIESDSLKSSLLRLESIDSFLSYNVYNDISRMRWSDNISNFHDSIDIYVYSIIDYENQNVEYEYTYNKNKVSLIEEETDYYLHLLRFLVLEDGVTDIDLEFTDYQFTKID